MTTNRIPLQWMTVWASDDATPVFLPCTPWIEAADVGYARVVFEVGDVLANMEIEPGWQVAECEDSPGAVNSFLTSPVTSKDVYYPDGWTNILTDGTAPSGANMVVRFGWLVAKSSGNAGLACATVGGIVEYQVR